MIHELPSASTASTRRTRVSAGQPRHSTSAQSAVEQGARLLQVVQRLQTSLDPERVLELFVEAVGAVVDIDGARYGCEEAAISCRFGRQTRHSCAYRLTVEGRELGEVIFLRGRSFSESEMQDIEHLLVALVYPLRNALAHRSALLSARRDALTGLGNRASLDEQLDRELQFATRHTQPLSVALLDIDHFKAINDLNGHAAGDHVLRALAETLRGCVRDSDLAFRYGGEEFAVILSNTGLEGAAQVAERIRGAIAEADFRLPDGTRLSVTGSLGVAEHQLGETREGLMERADQALYRAKAEGRNRTAA